MDLASIVRSKADFLIGMRRRIHAHPELSGREFETAALVREELTKAGIEWRPCGLQTGTLAEIRGAKPGRTVLLRADMDALPVTETTGASFASCNPGVMHACGHDAHTSTGLAVAHWFADNVDQMNGKIKILFQPAEEGVRGAAGMAASGILDDADYFLGAHIAMMCKSGEVSVNPYGFLCTTKLDVTYTGRPAHAGVEPNAGHNAMAAACNAFVQLPATAAA